MISIEDLCGISEFVDDSETKNKRKKYETEMEFKMFDALPKAIRDFLNFSDAPLTAGIATHYYKITNYDESQTLNLLKGKVNEYNNSRRFGRTYG